MNFNPRENYTKKTYAYVAVGLIIACAVFLGLIFTVLGIYSLIASILFAIGAVAFSNVQKKKNNFPNLKIIMIFSYIFLGISLAVFAGGLIWSML